MLRKNFEFQYVYKRGKRFGDEYLNMYVQKNNLYENRLGIVVSSKIGNSVVRNRVTRLIKEIYRLNEDFFTKGNDIIFAAKYDASKVDFRSLEPSICELARKHGIFSPYRLTPSRSRTKRKKFVIIDTRLALEFQDELKAIEQENIFQDHTKEFKHENNLQDQTKNFKQENNLQDKIKNLDQENILQDYTKEFKQEKDLKNKIKNLEQESDLQVKIENFDPEVILKDGFKDFEEESVLQGKKKKFGRKIILQDKAKKNIQKNILKYKIKKHDRRNILRNELENFDQEDILQEHNKIKKD